MLATTERAKIKDLEFPSYLTGLGGGHDVYMIRIIYDHITCISCLYFSLSDLFDMSRNKKVLRNDSYICEHVKTKFISYKLQTQVYTVYKTFIVAASNSREQLLCGESKLKTRR